MLYLGDWSWITLFELQERELRKEYQLNLVERKRRELTVVVLMLWNPAPSKDHGWVQSDFKTRNTCWDSWPWIIALSKNVPVQPASMPGLCTQVQSTLFYFTIKKQWSYQNILMTLLNIQMCACVCVCTCANRRHTHPTHYAILPVWFFSVLPLV